MGNKVSYAVEGKGVPKASSDLDNLRDKFSKLQSQGAKGIGIGIAAGATGVALGVLSTAVQGVIGEMGTMIQDGSNLNETLSKSEVVFGKAASGVKAFGSTAAEQLGLSEEAAISAAATFGNLFKSLGTAPEKIAPMSESLVKLASDLASFNNIPIEDALAKLQSGIVGQERPLRELGVAISAASVDAEALALGFSKVNGVFTEGQKVQARYALIFQQTTTAQGDFARTSNQLANSQRIAEAEMENISAEIGSDLLPAVLSLERGFLSLIDTIEGFKGQRGTIDQSISNTLVQGSLAQMLAAKAAIEKGLSDLSGPLETYAPGGQQAVGDLKAQLAAVDAAITAFNSHGGPMDDLRSATRTAFAGMTGSMDDLRSHTDVTFRAVGKSALDLAKDYDATQRRIRTANDLTITRLKENANELITGAFDPIIERDKLAATNAEINANKRVIASKKATEAEKTDARVALDQLHMDQAQYLVDLANTGQRTSKAYKDGVSELKTEISHATGPTKAMLQGVLDKLEAIDSLNPTVTIHLKVPKGGIYITPDGKTHIKDKDWMIYDTGGVVPGPPGSHHPAIVEAGERVLTKAQRAAYESGGSMPGSSTPVSSWSGAAAPTFNITINAGTGSGLTPGGARQFVADFGPALYADMQRKGFLPRAGTGLRG